MAWSIRQKLMLLAAMVLVSFIIIAVVFHYGVQIQKQASKENRLIQNMQDSVNQINIGLLRVRRQEKEFLLSKDVNSLQQHKVIMQSNFVLIDKLKKISGETSLHAQIDKLKSLFVDYQKHFNQLVAIERQLGLSETQGLRGRLHQSVREIQQLVGGRQINSLQMHLLSMRRLEEEFINKKESRYATEMQQRLTQFLKQINQVPLRNTVRDKIRQAIVNYQQNFSALTQGMQEIDKELVQLADVTQKMEPIFNTERAQINEKMKINFSRYQSAQNWMVRVITLALVTVAGFVLFMVWLISRAIVSRIDSSLAVVARVAEGDLTTQIDSADHDEMGRLQAALKNMVERLREIISEVNSTSHTVNQAVDEISSGNLSLSRRTEEQATSLEQTASSMQEMTAIVKESANSAHQANDLARTARSQAEQGGAVVNKSVEAMENIKRSSKKIADIITVVEDIAFQTNLLALNAAVEAARAGEQGRGFAVVAAEVRELAVRSSDSAKEIRELIEDSVERIQIGAEAASASGETLSVIVKSITQVAEIISELAMASEQQYAGINQVNNAVLQMDKMTQDNSALVEEAASSAKSLQNQVGQLNGAISFFKTS